MASERDSMSPSKLAVNTRSKDKTVLKRLKAMELRVAGRTYRQIGIELRTDPAHIHRWLKEEFTEQKRQRQDLASVVLEIEHARLEDLYALNYENFKKTIRGESQTDRHERQRRITETMLKIHDRMMRLLAIDDQADPARPMFGFQPHEFGSCLAPMFHEMFLETGLNEDRLNYYRATMDRLLKEHVDKKREEHIPTVIDVDPVEKKPRLTNGKSDDNHRNGSGKREDTA